MYQLNALVKYMTLKVALYYVFPHDILGTYSYYILPEMALSCRRMSERIYVICIRVQNFRPDIQKPHQIENAVRDILCHLW